jgi:hypothetical protein
MALLTCGGTDVLRARILLALDGAWTALLDLDTDTAPSGQVTIAAEGGLSLTGTVVSARAGADLDVAHVRIVGGAGGLATEVSGAFRSAKLRDALNAIASATGESLDDSIDEDLLDIDLRFLTLGRYSAGRALGELASIAAAALDAEVRWRITDAGALWIGEEAWTAATLPTGAAVVERFPGEGRYVIACETPALLPGVDLDDVGHVVAVEHIVEPSSVTSIAWTSTAPTDRLRRSIREAIGLDPATHLPAIDRLALYRAEIKSCAADGSTVDLQPESSDIPAMQAVPVKPCAAGDVAVMAAGTVCRVGWEEGNPTKPYAVPAYDLGATPTKRVINADALHLGGESGSKLLALHEDSVFKNAALLAWMSSVEGYINGLVPGTVTPIGSAIGTVQSSATIARGK